MLFLVLVDEVALLDSPDELQSERSEEVGESPDGSEEVQLGVGHEARELDGCLSACAKLVYRVLNSVPHRPQIVLKDLVVHEGAEEEIVAKRAYEKQACTLALQRLEVLPPDDENERDDICSGSKNYQDY